MAVIEHLFYFHRHKGYAIMSNRLIACIYLDFFLVAVTRHLNPALAGAPVIIGGDPRQHGQVIQASPQALARGIRVGMATWEALRRCPEAILERENPAAARTLALQVAHCLEDYSPRVEHAGHDCFFLDLTGGAPPLAEGQAIQQRLYHDLALIATVGIAANRLVAGIAARSQCQDQDQKMTSPILVPAGSEAAFLAPLPIECLPGLDLEVPLRERLHNLGIKKIGDLQAMSPWILAAQFGKKGQQLYHIANAHDTEGSPALDSLVTREVFDHRLGDLASLRRWAIFLCSRLGRQLRESHRVARSITLTLVHPEHPPTVLTGRLARPSDVDQLLFQAVEQVLQGCRLPAEGVISLEVEASELTGESQQLSLFSDRLAKRDARLRILNNTANRIERTHGEGAILVASILDKEILNRLRVSWHGWASGQCNP